MSALTETRTAVGPPSARQRAVVVIGAGPAGLSAAAELTRYGFHPLVLEQALTVGASWAARYDRLRLNTIRWMSGLPGQRIPRRAGRWVSRDDYVSYLRRYTERWPFGVALGTRAQRVTPEDGGWVVETDRGPVRARDVVIATGYDRVPLIPKWPGLDSFQGELVHSGSYRNARPYRGRRVLVVGSGNSGTEIALDLAEGGAATVQLSLRHPPTILRREWRGIPVPPVAALGRSAPRLARDLATRALQRLVMGDLRPLGLAPPGRTVSEQLDAGRLPNIDNGFVGAVRRSQIEVVPALERLKGHHAELSGERRVPVDVVIAATAYRRGLEPIVGHLGVLDRDGRPLVAGDRVHPRAPGLRFIGYRVRLSGHLPELSRDARRIARAIAAEHQLGPH